MAFTSTYRVGKHYGKFLVTKNGGEDLPSHEIREIISDLTEQAIRAGEGATVQEIIDGLYCRQMERLQENSEWVFPPFEEGQLHQVEACVYFMMFTYESPIIKIGHTRQFPQRMNAFFNENEKKPLKICAVAQTSEHHLFETVLHRHFQDHRVKGEWFARQAVLHYLYRLRGYTLSAEVIL